MLKFLDNRTHQTPAKSPKKFKPQFSYGNSFECPRQFQKNHTLFYKPSYVNPYLNYEQERVAKFQNESAEFVKSSWKHKTDLQSIQEQKILSSNPDLQDVRHSRYLTSFYSQFDKNQARFRKSRGQFTCFIQMNNKFKPLGPLHGDQRGQARINQTKKSVWLKPNRSDVQSVRKSFLNSDLNLSVKSSMSKNSQLITEKQRIRKNREKSYFQYKNSLQNRKIKKANSLLFQLPRKGPQHELTCFNPRLGSLNRHQITRNNIQETQSEQTFRDLNKFQVAAHRRIK